MVTSSRWVVDASLKGGVLAAVRARAPSALVRRISPLLLMQLPKPVPLILSGQAEEAFGPAELLSLRRTVNGPIRYAPALIIDAPRSEHQTWVNAGAIPVRGEHAPERQVDRLEEALQHQPPWVVSTVYIGPCRRQRRAMLSLHRRRVSDQTAPRRVVGSMSEFTPASLPRLQRRIQCAVVAIDSAPEEQRRDFVDLVGELDAAARASGDAALYAATTRFRQEARRLVGGRINRAEFDTAYQEVQSALNARAL